MNKILNNLTSLGKSFYALVIYYAVALIFSYIILSIKNLNTFTYNVILIASEITTVILLIILFRKRLKKDFIDFDKNYKKYLSFGFKIWILGMIVMILSNLLVHSFITQSLPQNQEVNVKIISRYPLYSVIGMIMIGPFIEEMTFRLGFKEYIKNKKLYYFLSVLIFASVHVLNGITSPYELLFYIPYGALALAFSYILDKTNNIFTTTIIHTFHNTLAIILLSLSAMMGV